MDKSNPATPSLLTPPPTAFYRRLAVLTIAWIVALSALTALRTCGDEPPAPASMKEVRHA